MGHVTWDMCVTCDTVTSFAILELVLYQHLIRVVLPVSLLNPVVPTIAPCNPFMIITGIMENLIPLSFPPLLKLDLNESDHKSLLDPYQNRKSF